MATAGQDPNLRYGFSMLGPIDLFNGSWYIALGTIRINPIFSASICAAALADRIARGQQTIRSTGSVVGGSSAPPATSGVRRRRCHKSSGLSQTQGRGRCQREEEREEARHLWRPQQALQLRQSVLQRSLCKKWPMQQKEKGQEAETKWELSLRFRRRRRRCYAWELLLRDWLALPGRRRPMVHRQWLSWTRRPWSTRRFITPKHIPNVWT